jgi:hypothetical protein
MTPLLHIPKLLVMQLHSNVPFITSNTKFERII